MLALKVIVVGTKLNSASNDDHFKERHPVKREVWAKMLILGPVYPADIHF